MTIVAYSSSNREKGCVQTNLIPERSKQVQAAWLQAAELAKSSKCLDAHLFASAYALKAVAISFFNSLAYLGLAVYSLVSRGICHCDFSQSGKDITDSAKSLGLAIAGIALAFAGLFSPKSVFTGSPSSNSSQSEGSSESAPKKPDAISQESLKKKDPIENKSQKPLPITKKDTPEAKSSSPSESSLSSPAKNPPLSQNNKGPQAPRVQTPLASEDNVSRDSSPIPSPKKAPINDKDAKSADAPRKARATSLSLDPTDFLSDMAFARRYGGGVDTSQDELLARTLDLEERDLMADLRDGDPVLTPQRNDADIAGNFGLGGQSEEELATLLSLGYDEKDVVFTPIAIAQPNVAIGQANADALSDEELALRMHEFSDGPMEFSFENERPVRLTVSERTPRGAAHTERKRRSLSLTSTSLKTEGKRSSTAKEAPKQSISEKPTTPFTSGKLAAPIWANVGKFLSVEDRTNLLSMMKAGQMHPSARKELRKEVIKQHFIGQGIQILFTKETPIWEGDVFKGVNCELKVFFKYLQSEGGSRRTRDYGNPVIIQTINSIMKDLAAFKEKGLIPKNAHFTFTAVDASCSDISLNPLITTNTEFTEGIQNLNLSCSRITIDTFRNLHQMPALRSLQLNFVDSADAPLSRYQNRRRAEGKRDAADTDVKMGSTKQAALVAEIGNGKPCPSVKEVSLIGMVMTSDWFKALTRIFPNATSILYTTAEKESGIKNMMNIKTRELFTKTEYEALINSRKVSPKDFMEIGPAIHSKKVKGVWTTEANVEYGAIVHKDCGVLFNPSLLLNMYDLTVDEAVKAHLECPHCKKAFNKENVISVKTE